MSSPDVAQVVQDVFVDVLGLATPVDWEAVRYGRTEGWDSLAHMAIIAELEDRLGIMLDTEDVIDLSSYERGVAIVRRLIGNAA